MRQQGPAGPEVEAERESAVSHITQRQLVAIAGAALLLLGIFAPIVTLPLVGSVNYFHNGKGDGSIIGALAVATVYFAITRKYKRLWWTGLGAAGVMLFTFIAFQLRISELKSSMEKDLAGNPFRGLADMAVGSIQLSWGWVILVFGIACVLFAAKWPTAARSD